jgi:hypothetical protein
LSSGPPAAWAERSGVAVISSHQDRLSGATAAEDRPGLLGALAALRQHQEILARLKEIRAILGPLGGSNMTEEQYRAYREAHKRLDPELDRLEEELFLIDHESAPKSEDTPIAPPPESDLLKTCRPASLVVDCLIEDHERASIILDAFARVGLDGTHVLESLVIYAVGVKRREWEAWTAQKP